MKFAHIQLFFLLAISFFITSCSVSVDQDENQVDEFTRQLDAAYSACANNYRLIGIAIYISHDQNDAQCDIQLSTNLG